MQKPSVGDVVLWALVSAGFWALAGMVTAMVFFSDASKVPISAPTQEHIRWLTYVIAAWAGVGVIMGLFALFRFIAMSALMGPKYAHPAHFIQMSLLSALVGALIGLFLYSSLPRPSEVVLMSPWGRVPICVVAGFAATALALRAVGWLGKFLP
jgi:hypothetical protein